MIIVLLIVIIVMLRRPVRVMLGPAPVPSPFLELLGLLARIGIIALIGFVLINITGHAP